MTTTSKGILLYNSFNFYTSILIYYFSTKIIEGEILCNYIF